MMGLLRPSALPHQVRVYHPDLNANDMTVTLIKITDKTRSLSFPDRQPASLSSVNRKTLACSLSITLFMDDLLLSANF
ncbi:hypothetical protein [Pantoea vagans]|uniref:hypothetical protein n=1 Tax=Pantoea vagans TaxID=470934 RepID=UPI003FA395CC